MSWRSVCVLAIFVAGGLTALVLKEKEAALLLIGAACGMGMVEKHNRHIPSNENSMIQKPD